MLLKACLLLPAFYLSVVVKGAKRVVGGEADAKVKPSHTPSHQGIRIGYVDGLYLGPCVENELELGGGGGGDLGEALKLLVASLRLLLEGLSPGLVILSPALVVVHIPLQGYAGMLPFEGLLIVLPSFLGRLIPAAQAVHLVRSCRRRTRSSTHHPFSGCSTGSAQGQKLQKVTAVQHTPSLMFKCLPMSALGRQRDILHANLQAKEVQAHAASGRAPQCRGMLP